MAMLIEFKVANYRSIRAEQTLSMVASNYSDELPQNLISCDNVPGMKGIKLVKAVALYGANASGKSNIVAALRFFAEFVRDSATKYQPSDPTGAQAFKLDPACLTEPSKFEITAVINGVRTLYGIEMTRERVTSEYLVAYPKGRPQVWFERDWDQGKGKYVWSKSTVYFKHDAALREKTRENAAFISSASQFNHEQAYSVWKLLSRNIRLVAPYEVPVGTNYAIEMLKSPTSKALLVEAMRKAELGIVDGRTKRVRLTEFLEAREGPIEVGALRWFMSHSAPNEAEGDNPMRVARSPAEAGIRPLAQEAQIPEFLHRGVGGALVPLDFEDEESMGTRRYFATLGELFHAAKREGALVIDEIEISMHPHIVHALVAAFFAEPNSAVMSQLLFTTHNPVLLDQTLLRRDQIWFTEKDQEGATRLYPLTDFKPRKDELLVKGYLAGRYGGIPFIPEGLKF